MFVQPPDRMSQVLSRSSSAASVCSVGTMSSMDDDASMSGLSAVCYPISAANPDEPPRRTRKRFNSTQLMMLEHLYHQTSHPTREQREVLAREANIELRSVTVWFQNKRQTERKVALSGVGPSSSAGHYSPMDTHEYAVFDNRGPEKPPRTKRTSGTSQTRSSYSPNLSTSPALSSASSSRTVRTHSCVQSLHTVPVLSLPGRPTLDSVASRAERSHPRTPTRASRSLPTLDLGSRADASSNNDALWTHMPSSPPSPPSSCDRDRELVDFSKRLGRRHLTLEYACAAARVSGKSAEGDDDVLPAVVMDVDDDGDDSERMLVTDTGGDTEDEGEHEAITPQSSQGSIGGRRTRPHAGLWKGQNESATQDGIVRERDADVMNAAIALCGLAGFS